MGIPSLPATDILILAAPFLAILGMAMVGLDERFANPRRHTGARRHFCEVDDQGGSFLSDPDGKVWGYRFQAADRGNVAPEGWRRDRNEPALEGSYRVPEATQPFFPILLKRKRL